MAEKHIIGVDIGGTKIAAGLVLRDGTCSARTVLPTLAERGFETSLEQVCRAVDELISSAGVTSVELEGIGVCAPGPLDPDAGIVYNPPNLPGWDKVPLAEHISARFALPVRLENDANAAGMAEVLWGAARGLRHVFYVTVSTGIGTAVIVDGKVYHGKNGMAGEGGHVSINYDDETICNCGTPGCIETLASGTAVAGVLRKELRQGRAKDTEVLALAGGEVDNISMEHIERAARKGDRMALELIQRQGRLLGIWLGGMISVLDPEMIVVGGGVSMMGEMLLAHIRESIPSNTINMFAADTPVVQAALREDVGICGAASIMMNG